MASNSPVHAWLSFASVSVFCLNLPAPPPVAFRQEKPWVPERPCCPVALYSQPAPAGITSFLNSAPSPLGKVLPPRCAVTAVSLGPLPCSAGALAVGSCVLQTSVTGC